MKITLENQRVTQIEVDLLALGAFQDSVEYAFKYQDLEKELDGSLGRIAAEEDFKAKEGQSLLLHTLDRLPCQRVLLIGLGKREDYEIPDTRRYAARAVQEAIRRGCRSMAVALPPLDPSAREMAVQFVVEGAQMGRYRFERYLEKDARTRDQLESTAILLDPEQVDLGQPGPLNLALARGQVISEAINWTRDLVNEPACAMTPVRLADLAQDLAERGEMSCKILGPKECEKQKMRLLLAVSRGSSEEPRFIHLTYRPKGKEKPRRSVALVGKGVTFDSGGLSIKTGPHMLDMKTDMSGAAAVLGVARALPKIGLVSTEVQLLVPATENMISGRATKVGDIITGLAGKSVEIANTDAEGRLILADALAYGVKLGVDEMLDMATLTGACMVALGPHIAGVMGNDRAMVERFLAAARRAGEEAWPLPLPARLKEQLKSPVADMKNMGERFGGALTAGLFLREFVDKTPWIHLDIAGPASLDKEWGHIPRGGTGFGVASVMEYLRSRDDIG